MTEWDTNSKRSSFQNELRNRWIRWVNEMTRLGAVCKLAGEAKQKVWKSRKQIKIGFLGEKREQTRSKMSGNNLKTSKIIILKQLGQKSVQTGSNRNRK